MLGEGWSGLGDPTRWSSNHSVAVVCDVRNAQEEVRSEEMEWFQIKFELAQSTRSAGSICLVTHRLRTSPHALQMLQQGVSSTSSNIHTL
jgi:hypothetical protein